MKGWNGVKKEGCRCEWQLFFLFFFLGGAGVGFNRRRLNHSKSLVLYLLGGTGGKGSHNRLRQSEE